MQIQMLRACHWLYDFHYRKRTLYYLLCLKHHMHQQIYNNRLSCIHKLGYVSCCKNLLKQLFYFPCWAISTRCRFWGQFHIEASPLCFLKILEHFLTLQLFEVRPHYIYMRRLFQESQKNKTGFQSGSQTANNKSAIPPTKAKKALFYSFLFAFGKPKEVKQPR